MNKKRILAFVLSVMIVAESGLTALAAEVPAGTPGVTEYAESGENTDPEAGASAESPTTEATPENTPEAVQGETPAETSSPSAVPAETPVPEDGEGTPSPEATVIPETTPTAEPEASPDATPSAEAEESPSVTPSIEPEASPEVSPSPEESPTPSASPSPLSDAELSVMLAAGEQARPESAITEISGLTNEQLAALNSALGAVADRVALSATVSEDVISLSGTLKAVYLADEDEMKYDMAFRIVPGTDFSKDSGSVVIAYQCAAGTEGQTTDVKLSMPEDAKSNGYWDVLIDATDTITDFTITVDYDAAVEGEETTVYAPKTYRVSMDEVRKDEASLQFLGEVTESTAFGIKASAPRITGSDDWEKVTVIYDAVSWTDTPNIGESDAHYYAALCVPVPEVLRNVSGIQEQVNVQADDENAGGKFGYKYNAEKNAFDIWIDLEQYTEGNLTVKWNEKRTQTIRFELSEDCCFEQHREQVQIPKSLAFNGIAKSMVVGQSLMADITITKSYAEDQVKVVYSSSDTDVISINRLSGVMQALKPGTAVITVAAVDADGNVSTAKNACAAAKITVSALKAPTGINLSNIRDTSVTVSWKANPAIGEMEIYAVPYTAEMGTKAAEWVTDIENKIKQEEIGFAVAADAAASMAEVTELCADTEYVFYLRNTVENALGETVSAGAVSAKSKTKTTVFDKVLLTAQDTAGQEMTTAETEEGLPVFQVSNETGLPEKVSYKLVDAEEESVAATYTNVAYKSTNAKAVKVDAKGKLTLGGQAGTARIYVTGKDSSGAVRESEGILIRVVKAPTKLTKKTTKLAVGATVKLTELIKTDVTGTTDQIDFTALDMQAIQEQFNKPEFSGLSMFSDGGEGETLTAQNAMVRAEGTSGTYNITFKLKGETGSAVATVTLTDMTAPAIKKTVTRDTTAELQFTPSASVAEVSDVNYYYTAELTDNVTGQTLTLTSLSDDEAYSGSGYAYRFSKEDSLYTCKLYGLSANESYTAAVTAHYKANDKESTKLSKAVKFTTQKELLTQGGSIDVRYVALDDLRGDSAAQGETVDYNNEEGIILTSNTTYALFAQVSNLARALETDKLTWQLRQETKRQPR